MGILNKVMLALNILLGFLTLGGHYAYLFNPADFSWPAFLGLGFPILVLFNIFFIIYWLFFKRWKMAVSLVTLILCWPSIHRTYRLNTSFDQCENCIRVMSYNAHYFNMSKKKLDVDTIIDYIDKAKPDVLCLQEFYSRKDQKLGAVEKLKKTWVGGNTYIDYFTVGHPTNNMGDVIASRHPILKKGLIDFGEKTGNRALYADIQINGKIVRFYNVHLQSIRFENDDYKYISKLAKDKDADLKKSRNIMTKLRKAFEIRAKQAEILKKHMAECPYPMVVCGDFNDTPTSYAYQTIADNMEDAFVNSGTGFGKTYIGPFPNFRIDYILHSKSIETNSFKVHNFNVSDHRPLTALLTLQKN